MIDTTSYSKERKKHVKKIASKISELKVVGPVNDIHI